MHSRLLIYVTDRKSVEIGPPVFYTCILIFDIFYLETSCHFLINTESLSAVRFFLNNCLIISIEKEYLTFCIKKNKNKNKIAR